MLKKSSSTFIFLLIMVLLMGCSKASLTDVPKDSQQNKKDSNILGILQPTNSQPQNQIKSEDSSIPYVTAPFRGTTQKSTIDMKTYLKSEGKLQAQGLINNQLGIHMELQVTQDQFLGVDEEGFNNALLINVNDKNITKYEGDYYYDGYLKKIRVEATLYSSGYISIAEFDENNEFNGAFGGFITDKSIIGMWNNKDGKFSYPFYIKIENGSQITKDEVTLPTSRVEAYKRINSNDDGGAYLTIYTEVDGKFKFTMSGYWHDHTGLIDGIAVYTDNTRKTAGFHFTDDQGKELDMTFIFDGKNIVVSANDAINDYGGANVSLIGTFQRK